jgi:hypothetical protein
MPKQPAKLTEEELKGVIQLEIGSKTAEIAEGVFRKLYEDKISAMDGKVSRLIYGGIIATGLVLIALIVSTWLFMDSYQQHYLDTQSAFSAQINDLRKENMNLQIRLEAEVVSVKDKEEYLERFLLGNVNK